MSKNPESVNRTTNFNTDTGGAALTGLINAVSATSLGARHTKLEIYEMLREAIKDNAAITTASTAAGAVTSSAFTGS